MTARSLWKLWIGEEGCYIIKNRVCDYMSGVNEAVFKCRKKKWEVEEINYSTRINKKSKAWTGTETAEFGIEVSGI